MPESARRGPNAWRREQAHRVPTSLWALVLACASMGCESEAPAKIHLNLGARPEDQRSFVPKAALAEYTEFVGEGGELRVTLSSHPITCETYLPLANDQILVSLTFNLPHGTPLQPGHYLWTGLDEVDVNTNQPRTTPAPAASMAAGATPGSPPSESPTARVLPFIRLGKHGVELPAGGHVELTEIRLDAQGSVRGLLKIEQAGSVGLPATSLLGSFSARWCRISALSPNDHR